MVQGINNVYRLESHKVSKTKLTAGLDILFSVCLVQREMAEMKKRKQPQEEVALIKGESF